MKRPSYGRCKTWLSSGVADFEEGLPEGFGEGLQHQAAPPERIAHRCPGFHCSEELDMTDAERRQLWRSYVDAYFPAQGRGRPQEGRCHARLCLPSLKRCRGSNAGLRREQPRTVTELSYKSGRCKLHGGMSTGPKTVQAGSNRASTGPRAAGRTTQAREGLWKAHFGVTAALQCL